MLIPSVPQFSGEGVGMCNRHNLHCTGYTENDTQRIVDSQGVACLPSLLYCPWSFDLCTAG